MQHGSSHPIMEICLIVGSFFGIASLQDLDLALSVTLKVVSIASFLVAIGYTIYKWKTKVEVHKKTMEIISNKENEKK